MSKAPKFFEVSHPTRMIDTRVVLPGSKSESNRFLVLDHLSGGRTRIENLSSAGDTLLLQKLLKRGGKTVDVKDCGTCLRFLVSCFCILNRNKIITGSPRLCERPVGPLVDALRSMGFKLNYAREEGHPPVEVIPIEGNLVKNKVAVPGGESSQYVSALAMIAPMCPDGLSIKMTGANASLPYVLLTLDTLAKFGIDHKLDGDTVAIGRQPWNPPPKVKVGGDWSAAAAWYAVTALSDKATIDLEGLDTESGQGDQVLKEWMKPFGVETEKHDGMVRIRRSGPPNVGEMAFDFRAHPDLAPSVITLAAALNIKLKVSGIENLRIKESDRLEALVAELRKVNAWLEPDGEGYRLKSNFRSPQEMIKTYDDHRMAMAFGPLALAGKVVIENPMAVGKSYPAYWDDMRDAGFEIET